MSREPEFLGVEAFAERVGLSPLTVAKMLRDRRLAGVKTSEGRGGSWMIPTSEIERLHAEAQAWRVPPEE